MSEVISFRLNMDNTREAKALRVISRWKERGYNTRYIVTEALLGLDDTENTELITVILAEFNEKFSQLSQIFEQSGFNRRNELITYPSSKTESSLSDSFIHSIKEAVKPGIKLK